MSPADQTAARDRPTENLIEVRGLLSQFGDRVIHENLDLTVERGEVLGVVGGSGTGKTVLLNSIIGLKEPEGGTVQILGYDRATMSQDDEADVERRTGILFQQGALFSSLSVIDNVASPLVEHTELSRDVIRELKKKQLSKGSVEGYFRNTVMPELEKQIGAHRVVDLPNRPMVMRLASAAESAAQPAPHFLPAPLIGNTGQQGQFVLPLGNPASAGKDGKSAAYDDFTYEAGAWTLTAHEGRPGHELQFTAMVERGISVARTLFAFNSVNVEGWALYAEAEMVPYEPIDGQLIALQLRLMRAARAMLDPMLNLGLIDRERANQVLMQDVVLSEPMARQELDRYTFNAPGQAGAYFYGYSRIMELRMETELTLGAKFDRMAYNNFLLDQGLLPPDQLAKAVREVFVPAQRDRN